MNKQLLEDTAKQMVATGKGLLAADESSKTCQKRFDAVGVECTEETRRQYRGVLLGTPHIDQFLSGVIFYDETFWQKNDDGLEFREALKQQGILPGIKVDEGLIDLPGFGTEKLTKGLDNLPDRMAKYAQAGARFAKWRAVITISDDDAADPTPTDAAIDRLIVEPLRAAAFVRDGDRLAVDVGSGGGSPAIPIALACPRLHMTLVEVRARKAAFLREAVRTLALTGARVEAVAFGALAGDSSLAKQVDVVTMRAVRADREIWTTIDALLAPRGQVLWLGGDPEAIETTTFAPVAHEDAVLVIARR